MRRLHSVGKHEKFVASGQYITLTQGVDNRLREHWSIHEVGGGAHFIRVDIDGRGWNGESRLIEALWTPEDRFERIDEQIFERGKAIPIKISQNLFDEQVELTGIQHDRRYEAEVAMPPGYGLWSESWLITGFMLNQAVGRSGTISLLRVSMEDSEIKSSRVEITTPAQGTKRIMIGGQEFIAQCYAWHDDLTVCIDQYGVPLSAETSTAEIKLTRYARRPEVKPS